jgi:hypothetical protein
MSINVCIYNIYGPLTVRLSRECHFLSLVAPTTISLRQSQSQSFITTDGQSASLSWNKVPIWGLRPVLYYCQTVSGLFVWDALSEERTDLSFTFTAGPRQRSHLRVQIPWNSWPYITVSDSRLLFPSPPTTRRTTVEVLTPPPHGMSSMISLSLSVRVRFTLRLAVYLQSVRLRAEPLETHGQNFFVSQLNTCGHCPNITSSLTRGWVCCFQLLLALAGPFTLGSESRGNRNHILLSQIETSLFVASYDSQGYGGGILPRFHAGKQS